MLSQIREALGWRVLPGGRPEPLAPFGPHAAAPGEGLVARFVSELEGVGGTAAAPRTEAELKEHLRALLSASPGAPVALSDGEALRRLGLRERLEEAGRPVVPSLREFVEEGLRAADPAPGSRAAESAVAALVEQYGGRLLEAAVGVTAADYALAETGTLVLVSGGEQHRLISLLPPAHVCLLDPARILPSLTQLLARLRRRFGPPGPAPQNMTCITGPSRTADIEQAITMGVHGPKSLHVVLCPTAD